MTRSYLIDTHILVWWATDISSLSETIFGILEDQANDIYISSAGLHEFAIKEALGRMPISSTEFSETIDIGQVKILSFDIYAMRGLGKLPVTHKDPFDRAFVAQAKVHNLTFITADHDLIDYAKQAGVQVLSPTMCTNRGGR